MPRNVSFDSMDYCLVARSPHVDEGPFMARHSNVDLVDVEADPELTFYGADHFVQRFVYVCLVHWSPNKAGEVGLEPTPATMDRSRQTTL